MNLCTDGVQPAISDQGQSAGPLWGRRRGQLASWPNPQPGLRGVGEDV